MIERIMISAQLRLSRCWQPSSQGILTLPPCEGRRCSSTLPAGPPHPRLPSQSRGEGILSKVLHGIQRGLPQHSLASPESRQGGKRVKGGGNNIGGKGGPVAHVRPCRDASTARLPRQDCCPPGELRLDQAHQQGGADGAPVGCCHKLTIWYNICNMRYTI